jgi:hypothetical protein
MLLVLSVVQGELCNVNVIKHCFVMTAVRVLYRIRKFQESCYQANFFPKKTQNIFLLVAFSVIKFTFVLNLWKYLKFYSHGVIILSEFTRLCI